MINKKIAVHMIDSQVIVGMLREIDIEKDGTITRKVEVTSDGNLKGKTIDINDKEVYIIANIG